jgi:uncharacterized protein (DUF305 family)
MSVVVAGLAAVAGPAHGAFAQSGPEAVAGGVDGRPAETRMLEMDRDTAYVEMMRQHAQRSLDMARIAVERAEREQLRRFAQQVVEDQQGELTELLALARALEGAGGVVPVAARSDDPDTDEMMARLREISGRQFDESFLVTFIAHQDMAVQLSRNPARFKSADVRAFAQRVGQRQSREIRELRLIQRAS